MFVNRGHKYLKQSLSGQASSTAQRSKHSLPLKTLVIEDERRSVAFHTSLVFPSVTTADECSCHTSPSLCLFIAEEWRGPVLGVWRKQGELRPFPAWLWCLSVGERRPTGPLLHWSTQTTDRDPAWVEELCWYLNTSEIYCFTLSLLSHNTKSHQQQGIWATEWVCFYMN